MDPRKVCLGSKGLGCKGLGLKGLGFRCSAYGFRA